ncbi:MAG: hypothetical protein KTR31_10900 [Myxococcales bacterium]|nr:hypothetical protein [Myxococcales bacterium]
MPTLIVLALNPSAHAFETLGYTWPIERMPVELGVADDGQPGNPADCAASGGLTACCEETLPAGSCYEAVQSAAALWSDATCSLLEFEVPDGTSNPVLAAPNTTSGPGSRVIFNDPDGIVEAGVPTITLSVFGGDEFDELEQVVVIFNDGMAFRQPGAPCDDAVDLQAHLNHHLGHISGLGHSCDEGEPCEPELKEAVMYWTVPDCGAPTELAQDDIDGLRFLYGPRATLDCGGESAQALDITCTLQVTEPYVATQTDFDFGDGSDGTSGTHTYAEQGTYTVAVEYVVGDDESCVDGASGTTSVEVTVCAAPEPRFEVDVQSSTQVQLLNETAVDLPGCINDASWTVFEGDSATGDPVVEPLTGWEPLLQLPEGATYTAVLELAGPGGTASATQTFSTSGGSASNNGGEGCGCSGSGGAAGWVWALGLAVAMGRPARRRRS